jgi:L-fuconolactonase
MKIDAHHHLWKYDGVRDAWITDEMSVLKRDFLLKDLAIQCQANGIGATVAVQADQSEDETIFLLEMAEQNPLIAGVVGWIDFCSPCLADRLRFFFRYGKLRGFRHAAQSEPDDRFLVHESFVKGVGCLSEFGFTYDILIYPKQLPAALELVAALPEQQFVIDHIAKPDIRTNSSAAWAKYMRTIAQNSNVYCKISGLVSEADWRAWKKPDFKPYLDVVFEAFGTERLMFGSDWPVCLLAASYGQVKDIVEDYLRDFSSSEKNMIFGENAIRFYGLKVDQHGLAT